MILSRPNEETSRQGPTRLSHPAPTSYRECFDHQEKPYDFRDVQEKRVKSALRNPIARLHDVQITDQLRRVQRLRLQFKALLVSWISHSVASYQFITFGTS